jgi:hypothetical protein
MTHSDSSLEAYHDILGQLLGGVSDHSRGPVALHQLGVVFQAALELPRHRKHAPQPPMRLERHGLEEALRVFPKE